VRKQRFIDNAVAGAKEASAKIDQEELADVARTAGEIFEVENPVTK
jgi:hypothetical protein